MKYNININQKVIIDLNLPIDLVDCAIIDVLKDFSHQNECKRMYDGGVPYYWFSWKLIVNQLPLSRIKTKQAVYNRFKKLEECNILVRHKDNKKNNVSFFTFGSVYQQLYFTPVNQTLRQPINNDLQVPVNETLQNNIDNSIIDINNNKELDSKSSVSQVSIFDEEELKPKKPKQESNIKLKKESNIKLQKPKSIFKQIQLIYDEWHKTIEAFHNLPATWNGGESKALKELIEKLKAIGKSKSKPEEQLDQYVIDCFNYILANFDHWGSFYQKSGLKLLNSKLNDVIINIKNGKEEEQPVKRIPKAQTAKRIPRTS